MSEFVPMIGSGAFRKGLVSGEDAEPAESKVVADDISVDTDARQDGEDDADALPSSPEELEALLEEIRTQSRLDIEAVLAADRLALENEREQVGRVIEALQKTRKQWKSEVRNMLGELVMVGVRQVVSDSAELQADMLRDRFAEVGERLIGEQDVLIRVRPEDEALAKEFLGDRDGWNIVCDTDMSGGLIAETTAGKVDATMGAAISGLADAVQVWQSEGVGEE
jgi:flagellar biosynthesis/type III secretory pathway protein FliH